MGLLLPVLLALVLLAGCGESGTGAGTTGTSRVQDAGEQAPILYVLQASGGTTAPVPGGEPGSYTVTFSGVPAQISRNAGAPVPWSDAEAASRLVSDWDNLFAETPPAAMVTLDPPAGKSYPMLLKKPVYDEASGTLSFTASAIPADYQGSTSAVSGLPLERLTPQFGPARLTIEAPGRAYSQDVAGGALSVGVMVESSGAGAMVSLGTGGQVFAQYYLAPGNVNAKFVKGSDVINLSLEPPTPEQNGLVFAFGTFQGVEFMENVGNWQGNEIAGGQSQLGF